MTNKATAEVIKPNDLIAFTRGRISKIPVCPGEAEYSTKMALFPLLFSENVTGARVEEITKDEQGFKKIYNKACGGRRATMIRIYQDKEGYPCREYLYASNATLDGNLKICIGETGIFGLTSFHALFLSRSLERRNCHLFLVQKEERVFTVKDQKGKEHIAEFDPRKRGWVICSLCATSVKKENYLSHLSQQHPEVMSPLEPIS